jgi:co-chaperonin GroES (HSP10)
MKVAPLGHRVLVKIVDLEDRDPAFKSAKAAGIVLAHTEEKDRRRAGSDRGYVVEVGPDAFKGFYLNSNGTLDGFKPWVKAGDFIAFAKYGGMVLSDPNSDDKYVVMNDEDVVAVLEDPK